MTAIETFNRYVADVQAGKIPVSKFARQAVERHVRGNTVGARDDHKEVAREVSDKFRIVLTPGEVKDIHCE